MLTFLAAMVIAIPTGDFAALEADSDEIRLAGQGDSSLDISMPGVGDPNQSALDEPEDPEDEPEDPEDDSEDPEDDPEDPDEDPGEDPKGPDKDPEIVSFAAYVTSGAVLLVLGTVDDEYPDGCTVRISWQGAEYEVGVESDGSFSWYFGLDENVPGIVALTAVDSAGNESATVQDLVVPD